MENKYDVIVIGVGSMGASACYYLAKRGAKVLGLDSQQIPNPNSSYNGNTRVIRLTYQEHPDYVPILKDSYQLWEEIQNESDEILLHKTGVLYMGFPEGNAIRGVELASQKHNLPYSKLTHNDLSKQFPQFILPEEMVGAFEPEGGYLLSELAVKTYTEQAKHNGASIITEQPVLRWSKDTNSIVVETESKKYFADQLIISAGAWSENLLNLIKLKLSVTRQVLGWVKPNQPKQFRRGDFPVWNIDPVGDNNLHGIYYGFPMSNDAEEGCGLKVAWHHPGKPMSPDAITSKVFPEDQEEILLPLRRYLPSALGPVQDIKVCKYTNSIDGHFIIDRHPESDRVHFACGFSGHGFKFSSSIGKILSELALDGQTKSSINFLSLKRFTL